MYKAAVITVSDRGAAGLREDKSGPRVAEILENAGYDVVLREMIPDQQPVIEKTLIHCVDEGGIHLVVTTGGTGFSLRDVTPEATLAVSERMVPGIAEAMRLESLKKTPRAMLSRGQAGLRKTSLILNLPGSPRGAEENLRAVLPTLGHGLDILLDSAKGCGEN